MGLIPVSSAAKILKVRDGFEASALLAQAGYRIATIDRTRYVAHNAVLEYAADHA